MGRVRTEYKENRVASLKLQDLPIKSDWSLEAIKSALSDKARALASTLYGYTPSFFSASPTTQTPDETKSISLTKVFESIESEIKQKFSELKPLDEEVKALNEKKEPVSQSLTQKRVSIKQKIDELKLKKVSLTPVLIKAHAQMRVDLFFLMLITVHKQHVTITKGKTKYQHGIGSDKLGTAACHSSLFPTINSEEKSLKIADVRSFLDQAGAMIESLINEDDFDLESDTDTEEGTDKVQDDHSIIHNTRFYDLNNITAECSVDVNWFDCILEGKWGKSPMVEKCLAIINAVSYGQMSPLQGLQHFAYYMSRFFDHIEYHYLMREPDYSPLKPTVPYPKVFKKVWEFQKEGTLQNFTIGKKPTDTQIDYHYLEMMLGLRQTDHFKLFVNKGLVMDEQLEKMQIDLLTTPSYLSKNKERLGLITRLSGYIEILTPTHLVERVSTLIVEPFLSNKSQSEKLKGLKLKKEDLLKLMSILDKPDPDHLLEHKFTDEDHELIQKTLKRLSKALDLEEVSIINTMLKRLPQARTALTL